mgnify:CR=1 FL=1
MTGVEAKQIVFPASVTCLISDRNYDEKRGFP